MALAKFALSAEPVPVRCYYVLIHGRLLWRSQPPGDEPFKPTGFYCHRYVRARNEQAASGIASRRVRDNLDRQTRWLSAGIAELTLTVEEIRPDGMLKLLKPDNRGHTFYV